MPLGTEVYLSPGHIVFDGNPASFPAQKEHCSPPPSFRRMSIVYDLSSDMPTAYELLYVGELVAY